MIQVGPSLLVLGNEARENGLKDSLLERLHQMYTTNHLYPAAQKHCATLLTNYRAHNALLSLPSYLFYNSTLVTAADANHQLHPAAAYPLYFVCSEFDSSITAVSESKNLLEADILLEELVKYVSNWPIEWGLEDLSTVGIIATTPDQVSNFYCHRKLILFCLLFMVYSSEISSLEQN